MTTQPQSQDIALLIQSKLTAFERLQPELEASFQFVQDVHGQKRFSSFAVADSVRYLHALWICECKGRLLSVPRTVKEDEGRRCLELLRHWQQRDTASVVDFLQHKLDMVSLAQITQHYSEAYHFQQDDGLAQRLAHGRHLLLNRGINLLFALDALFDLSEDALAHEVSVACERYGHLPEQIERQLEAMDSPLYTYVPHQILAQHNMRIMNRLGVNATLRPADLPSHRSWHILPVTEPPGPYAEHVVEGYQELIAPFYNNSKRERFVGDPERSAEGTV